MYALLVAIRIYEALVFAIAAGLAGGMALALEFANGERYRRPFLMSYALIAIAVVAGSAHRLIEGTLWTWWSSPIVLASAVAATVAMVMFQKRTKTGGAA